MKSFKTYSEGKLLKGFVTGGYLYVTLCNGTKQKQLAVHRLVAGAFLEKESSDLQVNHKDGDKLNNKVENLEWVTVVENVQHQVSTGLHKPPKGEAHYNTTLTEDDVIKIRQEYAKGSVKQSELATKYGITQVSVSQIITRKSWKHV